MQARSVTGIEFEKTHIKNGWVLKNSNPKIIWSGEGKNIFEKIINCNGNPKKFVPIGFKLTKHDAINEHGSHIEIKKYKLKKLMSWSLYSEPYFKMSNKSDLNKIDKNYYNKFVDDFYEYNLKLGLFDYVVEQMTSSVEGIMTESGFIEKDKLEFRTVVLKGWRGFKRITIQFKMK
jgi:hypothetical protein